MPISVNLTGVNTNATPLAPGYYKAQVSEVKEGMSKSSNQPKLSWEFTIIEPEEFQGRKVYYTTSLQQKALFNLKRLLIALGVPEEQLEGQIEIEPVDMVGMTCTLVLVEDEWDGKTVARVSEVLPADAQPDEA